MTHSTYGSSGQSGHDRVFHLRDSISPQRERQESSFEHRVSAVRRDEAMPVLRKRLATIIMSVNDIWTEIFC